MKTLNWRIILRDSLLALLGFAFGSALGRLLKYQKTGYELDAWLVILLPALVLAGILWHQFGHACFGWLAGYPFRLHRSLSLWGGVTTSTPRSGQIPSPEAMRQKLLLIVAGGPLASLAGGLLALPAWIYWESSPNWAVFCALLAFTNLALALSSLVPMTCTGQPSDGQRLLDLLANKKANRSGSISEAQVTDLARLGV